MKYEYFCVFRQQIIVNPSQHTDPSMLLGNLTIILGGGVAFFWVLWYDRW